MLKTIASEVGHFQLENFRKSNFEIEEKTTQVDLVTSIDKASETMIIDFLKANFNYGILSEERGVLDQNNPYQWVIDPLDGTTNFANGYPIFSISIALEKHGETQLGIVHVPRLRETYWAIKDYGAFCNDKPITVSSKKHLNKSVLATGFPYDRATHPVNNTEYFSRLIPKVRGIRRSGSAAFDLACVARGVIDGFWEINLSLWDVAAGKLLIKEAGGIYKRLNNKRGVSIISGPIEIVNKIMNVIEEVDKND